MNTNFENTQHDDNLDINASQLCISHNKSDETPNMKVIQSTKTPVRSFKRSQSLGDIARDQPLKNLVAFVVKITTNLTNLEYIC